LARHRNYFVRVFHDSAVEIMPDYSVGLECLAGSHQKSKFLGDDGLGGCRLLIKIVSRSSEQGSEECVVMGKGSYPIQVRTVRNALTSTSAAGKPGSHTLRDEWEGRSDNKYKPVSEGGRSLIEVFL
jgi:hypothetical protein